MHVLVCMILWTISYLVLLVLVAYILLKLFIVHMNC